MKYKIPGMLLALLAGVLVPISAYCETYTMDTYYPSPAGVYTNITVTSTTVLARDGGAVTVGTPSHPAKLNVSGNADITAFLCPADSRQTPPARIRR